MRVCACSMQCQLMCNDRYEAKGKAPGVFSLRDNLQTCQKLRATDNCLTQLTANVPVELGVEIGRVNTIG